VDATDYCIATKAAGTSFETFSLIEREDRANDGPIRAAYLKLKNFVNEELLGTEVEQFIDGIIQLDLL
jgi:hypothetical protein